MVLSDGKVVTSEVIMAFENITKPDDNGKYSVKVLIDKSDTATVNELTQLLQNKASSEKVPFVNPFAVNDRWHDGDVYQSSTGVKIVAYAGKWVINAKSGYPIGVINANGQPMDLNFEKDKFYSGAGIRICVDSYKYDNSGNKGVSLGLQGIQVVNCDKTQRPQMAESSGGGMNTQALANAFGVSAPAGSPAPTTAPTAAAPAPAPAPQNDFLAPPPVKRLVATGAHTIEALRNAGWGDDQMVSAGHAAWQ